MTQYEIQEESSLHKYRTEIPNIIFALELGIYEFKAYCVLKRTAGDKGRCFKSNKKLAEECGMSERQFIYAKQALTKPHEKLDGKSLIKITQRKTEKGDRDTDLILITDIWEINFKYFMVVHNVQEGSAQSAPGGAPRAEEERTPKERTLKEKSSSSSSSAPTESSERKNFKERMRKRITFTDQEFQEAWKRYEKRGASNVPCKEAWFEKVIEGIQDDAKDLEDKFKEDHPITEHTINRDEYDEEYSKKFWREADEERKAAFKENPESFR